MSITELLQGLKAKQFSALELTKNALAQMKKGDSLGCFLTSLEDEALKRADAADAERAKGSDKPLLGIPVAVKDNIVKRGSPTTCASAILNNFISPYDATAVEKLEAAGAIIVGKTNMDEFAMGSSNENSSKQKVKNPWDPERVPGGSSGGSAAAVAARMVPVALGSDTGGSIRQPAAFCGIVGMKPTYGRVSRYGLIAFASSLDQIGPLTTTVEDAAIVTSVLSGHDRRDSSSVDRPVPHYAEELRQGKLRDGVKGLRIGVPKEYFIPGMSAEVEKIVRSALAEYQRLGATIVEISLPHTDAALATYYILAPAEAASNLARFDGVRYGHRATSAKDLGELYRQSRSEGFGKEVKRRIMIGTYVLSAGYYDAFYLRAQRIRTLIARDFKNAFSEHCDVIACPTAPTTSFKIGEKTSDPLTMYLSDAFTIPVNLAGLPALSLPCGFDQQGLPVGLQLIAKPWDESTLFQAAHCYEQATSHHQKHPTGWNR
jgi:aspartyl-tRNA(Asn)/glutamyl-tRNA(Gln) amidotransferase subunit A